MRVAKGWKCLGGAGLAGLLVASLGVLAAGSQPFGPTAMLGIVRFIRGSEPVLAPDGAWVAYATARSDKLDANVLAAHPLGQIWVVKTSGGPPEELASGRYSDTPVWSPDGQRLAFFATRHGESRLALWNAATDRVREVGPAFPKDKSLRPTGFAAPQWSADGDTIVFAMPLAYAAPKIPAWQVLHTDDASVPGDAPFVDRRQWMLEAVSVSTGAVRALTLQPVAIRGFAIAPGGREVLYSAVTPQTLGLFRRERQEDWLVRTDGSAAPRRAFAGRAPAWAVFSPDGRRLIYPAQGSLRAVALEGGGEQTLLARFPRETRDPLVGRGGRLAVLAARAGTGPQDRSMYSILQPTWDVEIVDLARRAARVLTGGVATGSTIGETVWSQDGRTLFYRQVDPNTYRESILRWRVGDAAARPVLAGGEEIFALSPSADGGNLVFTAMSPVHPPEGFLLAAGGAGARAIIDPNPQLAQYTFVAPRMFDFTSSRGDPLRALLYLPAGAGRRHPVPVVTYVYEKLSSQRYGFNADAQWHVAHGYGYLEPDVLVRTGAPAASFVDCVVPAVKAVEAMGVTTGKIGIRGGSFGGYAGLVLISHSDVFAAAVLRAPPNEFFSIYADGRDRDRWTIDNGQARTTGTPWSNQQGYIANSPFFQADRIHAPLLIVQGRADYTVPFHQGVMIFSALRALERPATFLIFRDADHSISRGSRFRFRSFHEHTMAWWARYLR